MTLRDSVELLNSSSWLPNSSFWFCNNKQSFDRNKYMFGQYARRNSFILQPIHGFTRAPTLIMKINRKVNRVIGGLSLLIARMNSSPRYREAIGHTCCQGKWPRHFSVNTHGDRAAMPQDEPLQSAGLEIWIYRKDFWTNISWGCG